MAGRGTDIKLDDVSREAGGLKIRVNGEDGKKYLAHTLNNTVVAVSYTHLLFCNISL